MFAEYAIAILLSGDDLRLEVTKANNVKEAVGICLERYKGECIKTWTSSWLRDLPGTKDQARQAAIPFLADGRKIAAIKEVRAVTGWGLKEAKAFVDDMVDAEPHLLGPVTVPF